MIKRIMICTLCFILCFSICSFADETTDPQQEQPVLKEDMPQQGGGRMGGGQRPFGGMGGGMPLGVQPMEGQQPPEITMPDSGNMPDFQVPDNGNMPTMPQDSENTEVVEGENTERQWGGMQGGRGQFDGFPGMEQNAATQPQTDTPTTFKGIIKEYFTPILSVILLAFAFIFVIFYKRKKY